MPPKIGWRCRWPIRVPVDDHLQELSCGRCLPCLIRRERAWTLRQKLEQASASFSYFVTLTYSDQNRLGFLQYNHVQTFLRSLRDIHPSACVRFFCSGEYGALKGREHWHVNIFSTTNLQLQLGSSVIKQWPYGAIFTGTLTPQSMGYVAQYVLEGKPPITQMSRRPGIGVPAIRQLAQRMRAIHDELEDIPTTLHVGKDLFPLDRTLRWHFEDAWLRAGGTVSVKKTALKIYTDRWDTLRLAIASRGTQELFQAIDLKTERLLAEEKHGTPF